MDKLTNNVSEIKSKNTFNKKFNYISLDFIGEESQELILKKMALEGLSYIKNNFNNISSTTDKLIEYLSEEKYKMISTELNFTFPHQNQIDHWHMTLFFKKKGIYYDNLAEDQKKIIQEFEKDKYIKTKIISLVYIPDKILTLFCQPECSVNNKFPHITLLVKNEKPFLSNILLQELFENEEYLKQEYENHNKDSNEEEKKNSLINPVKYFKLNTFDINNQDCYYYKFEQNKYELIGKMNYNF